MKKIIIAILSVAFTFLIVETVLFFVIGSPLENINEHFWSHWWVADGDDVNKKRMSYNGFARYHDELGYINHDLDTYLQKGSSCDFDLVFIGDSVTALKMYTRELTKLINQKNPALKILNAGVSGWGTKQEVLFIKNYLKYNKPPELIILQVHPNDVYKSPVFIKEVGNKWLAYDVNLFSDVLTSWLLSYSKLMQYLFKFYVQRLSDKSLARSADFISVPLREIINLTNRNHIKLHVVFFPYFRTFNSQDTFYREAVHSLISSQIMPLKQVTDLTTKLVDKLKDLSLYQMTPGDSAHPNWEASKIAADIIWSEIKYLEIFKTPPRE